MMTDSCKFLPFTFPGVPAVRCLFSTRQAGDMGGAGLSPVTIENRQNFMARADFKEWCEVHQVHGDDSLEAVPAMPASQPSLTADGLYTAAKGRGLLIKTADCQAILFAKKDGTAVGAIHAGWRGNRLKFPTAAIEQFCARFTCSPSDVVAVRGPSLGMAEFVNFDKEWSADFSPWFNEQTRIMDLWGLTRHQLGEAGIPSANIYGLDLCTLSQAEMFYSHRHGDTGRQLSAIWIV